MTCSKLYIIPRTDLASMTSGRAIAQCAHAANQFTRNVMDNRDKIAETIAFENYHYSALNWHKEGDGFGTTIVVESGIKFKQDEFFDLMIEEYKKTIPYIHAGIIVDPTYPIKDGNTVHYISIVTCAYVYVPDYAIRQVENYEETEWEKIYSELSSLDLYGPKSSVSVS